jgi:glycosyltransferase involved in cell wall biosynthesis
MKNVLIINQSSELYGSDKALLELIENFPKTYNPIVVLEHEGPLKDILIQKNIQVIKCPVIKLNRSLFSVKGIFNLCVNSIKSIYILRKETRKIEINLVHSNSIAVLLGAFYSFVFRKKHLWHVHEIVEEPKILAKLYPKLVSFFSNKIIFNSNASYHHFFKIKPSIKSKSIIIHNGQNRKLPQSSTDTIHKIKTELFKTQEDKIIIGLVGRISRWKGQSILLNAFYNLNKKHANLHLVFIGSPPPNQAHFLENLEKNITDLDLSEKVTIVDFQTNIWQIYDALDICVVPSTEPEPFGLVATEAMLSSKPVIAANHGGLMEIVIDNETGFLFEPKNQADLELKLASLINNPELSKQFGAKGNQRVKENFSTENYVTKIKETYDGVASDYKIKY